MTDLKVAALVSILLASLAAAAHAAAPADALDPARLQAVAAMLPEHPTGLGRPITDRAAWERLGADPAYKAILAKAAEDLARPLPEQPDDLFLEYSRNGNRSRFQAVAFDRRWRITSLVIAECIENKGRYLPAIEKLVEALAVEKTWVLPAHDGSLKNFKGESIDIDLFSSAVGWHLATANYLLGDKLSAPVRQKIRENVARRILDPYRDMVTGKREKNGWLTTTNNWNAVCLAGVTGAALAQAESREDRAIFVVAAEKFSKHFLAGFTPDGYCSEGLGYWNYGFGHYVLLGEMIRRATGGQVDLMARPEARAPAMFAAHIQIIGGVAPAFADCAVNARPSPAIMYYLNRRFGLGLEEYRKLDLESPFKSLSETMIFAFPDSEVLAPPAAAADAKGPLLRDWFEQAGILIGRPAADSKCTMGVALKGGHNAEHHNHNDVGSYVVVVKDTPVLLDPGAEVYTARTFSSRRYDSKLLNSFGHAVPVVAGQLQRTGRDAQAKVLRADFTD
ncbi:MAG: heparinase II/III family protein, partial [Planctomycetota bacterium]|nr:heparinase II/III family protein [Planctomycetota bacterium]